MMSRKTGMITTALLLSIILITLFLQNIFISAQATSFCCEKTNSGAWCQNAPQEECATGNGLRSVPTSCEATSYCKLGTCVNTGEGTCKKNTPRRVCEKEGGFWYDKPLEEVSQCQLGCCLMSDQAAFVTQTRCKKLSSLYGLETNFNSGIRDEVSCIQSATPKAKGACVLEKETGRTCRFVTKEECQDMQGDFHQGLLCSAEELRTECGPRGGTTCVDGRDEVYFLDTCGNIANVYDASKLQDEDYWTYIQPPTCSVNSDGASSCGNCDYYGGSTCKQRKLGEKVDYGDNICRDLSCDYEPFKKIYGRNPRHGETWCQRIIGTGEDSISIGTHMSSIPEEGTFDTIDLLDISHSNGNLPGSRDFRMVCYNGEVTVEPCADYRQEICIQSEVGEGQNTFKTASCRANLWRDCYLQDNKKDCENEDKRDCVWVRGVSILTGENGEELVVEEVRDENNDILNERLVPKEENDERQGASCVPKYPPGFDFWNEETDAEQVCEQASIQCFVKYQKAPLGKWRVVTSRTKWLGNLLWTQMLGIDRPVKETELICLDNEGNIIQNWKTKMENTCSALGDCGISVNYIGKDGYYKEEDLLKVIGKLGLKDNREAEEKGVEIK